MQPLFFPLAANFETPINRRKVFETFACVPPVHEGQAGRDGGFWLAATLHKIRVFGQGIRGSRPGLKGI
jgi:hypothetical protein